jgi:hypothetical protein
LKPALAGLVKFISLKVIEKVGCISFVP